MDPTFLILDEPTNHLDLEACVWLEDVLSQFKRILLLVSHSQDFMNGVCTNIINMHQKQLHYYAGACWSALARPQATWACIPCSNSGMCLSVHSAQLTCKALGSLLQAPHRYGPDVSQVQSSTIAAGRLLHASTPDCQQKQCRLSGLA